MNKKTNIRITRTVVAIGMFVTAFLVAGSISALAHEGDCESKECRAALVRAKRATAQYHDYSVALASGYAPTGPCVALPTGEAMGFHHTKFSLVDLAVDEAEPEVLLYCRTKMA